MDTSRFERLTRRIPAIAVGTLDGDRTEVVGLGTIAQEPDPGGLVWEIGSITKVFTGILLAEMSLRGEVRLEDPIGRYAPPEVAERLPKEHLQPTLADLSAHTAGLPRIPREWFKRLKGADDPYAQISERDVWDQLGSSTNKPRRLRSRYSNYGVGLLGHLLGQAAGTTYQDLVSHRIIEPLRMTSTGFGATPVQGLRKGRPTPPWTFKALAGAGALRSTVDDMLRFGRACIYPPDGALGAAIRLSRRPVWEGRVRSVGLGWMIRSFRGSRDQAIWHNGGTYGGSSFLAIHATKPLAVVSFGNVGPRLTSPLDGPSWRLFDELG